MNVRLDDLSNFDEILHRAVRDKPQEYLPIVEEGVQQVYKELYMQQDMLDDGDEEQAVPEFQVQFSSEENPRMLR